MDDKTVMCMIWAETTGIRDNYVKDDLCGPMHYNKKLRSRKCKEIVGTTKKKPPIQPKDCKNECAQIQFSVYLLCNCGYDTPKKWGTDMRNYKPYCCCEAFGTFGKPK
jgi:hypothetical protein